MSDAAAGPANGLLGEHLHENQPTRWDCHVHVFDAQQPALPGHYQPAHRPIEQMAAVAAAHGVGHLVLVQPSVYGSDNRLLLQALQQHDGRHRGVLVLSGDDVQRLDAAALARLHRWGVRGLRLNAVSPVGLGAEGAQPLSVQFERLAPVLRAQAWHLQWYAQPAQLPMIAAVHAGSGVVAVLDHLAGLHAGIADVHPGWAALQTLAAQGAWVKLSGWYRLQAVDPYTALMPLVQRLAELFGDHLVWGSDWPHTWFAPDDAPLYASTWQPVLQALGAPRAARVHAAAAALYL